MARIAIRHYQTQAGLKWTATEASWSTDLGKIVEIKIEPIALQALGFSLHMTPAQAKAHANTLNAMSAVTKKDQHSKIKAAERLTDLITIENSIVPDELSRTFIIYIEENWFGGQYNLRKTIQHWNLVQKIITSLKLQPHEYFKRQKTFYKYFEKHKYSKSYVEKLLKVVNQWGEFYSESAKLYFKRVPNPKGIMLEAILDASDADGEGAGPLTPEILSAMRLRLPAGQWEYIRATLWLGLRPCDLDGILANPKLIKAKSQGTTTILSIYQPKLTSVTKERRWKHVPLFHVEMQNAYADIQSGIIRKPLVKTLRTAAPQLPTIGLYSGRKGFTDLMLALDQTLVNASMWMGHASIERTWKHYKNKNIVSFEVPRSKVNRQT